MLRVRVEQSLQLTQAIWQYLSKNGSGTFDVQEIVTSGKELCQEFIALRQEQSDMKALQEDFRRESLDKLKNISEEQIQLKLEQEALQKSLIPQQGALRKKLDDLKLFD